MKTILEFLLYCDKGNGTLCIRPIKASENTQYFVSRLSTSSVRIGVSPKHDEGLRFMMAKALFKNIESFFETCMPEVISLQPGFPRINLNPVFVQLLFDKPIVYGPHDFYGILRLGGRLFKHPNLNLLGYFFLDMDIDLVI